MGCTCGRCRRTSIAGIPGNEASSHALAIVYAALNHGLVRHRCDVQGLMHIGAGEPCNWCGVTEPAPWLEKAEPAV